jgi:hypothetical protein
MPLVKETIAKPLSWVDNEDNFDEYLPDWDLEMPPLQGSDVRDSPLNDSGEPQIINLEDDNHVMPTVPETEAQYGESFSPEITQVINMLKLIIERRTPNAEINAERRRSNVERRRYSRTSTPNVERRTPNVERRSSAERRTANHKNKNNN